MLSKIKSLLDLYRHEVAQARFGKEGASPSQTSSQELIRHEASLPTFDLGTVADGNAFIAHSVLSTIDSSLSSFASPPLSQAHVTCQCGCGNFDAILSILKYLGFLLAFTTWFVVIIAVFGPITVSIRFS